MVTLALFVTACGPTAVSDRDVLISVTDEVIVPTYQALARDTAQMNQDVGGLCNAPSQARVDTARQSWQAARGSWTRSKAMAVGPVMERRSMRLLDWSPTNTAGMEELLAEGRRITVAEVQDVLASNLRGFGAIEQLLFHDDALADADVSGPRCAYLTALTEVAHREAGAILSGWVEERRGKLPYRDFFTGRSKSALLPSAAVAELVRAPVFLVREIVNLRLASARGLQEEGIDLSAIPGNAAGNGLEDLRNEVLGIQAVYEGAGSEGLGISALVSPLSKETDGRLRDQFDGAIGAIDKVEGPLQAAVVQRPEQVRQAHEALFEIHRTMATEMVSLLGVSVGFSDTDGDSLR